MLVELDRMLTINGLFSNFYNKWNLQPCARQDSGQIRQVSLENKKY